MWGQAGASFHSFICTGMNVKRKSRKLFKNLGNPQLGQGPSYEKACLRVCVHFSRHYLEGYNFTPKPNSPAKSWEQGLTGQATRWQVNQSPWQGATGCSSSMNASKPHAAGSRITAWVQGILKKKPEAADFKSIRKEYFSIYFSCCEVSFFQESLSS